MQQHAINGIYIYGIVKTSEPQEFGEMGIGDGAASRVLTVGFQDIAAVVSNSPWKIYRTLSQEQVLKDLAIHQLVVERVMKQFPIIPVKFGTMLETQDEVHQFLAQSSALLKDELNEAEGKIELDVVAWWELPKILTVISHHNEQIQKKQQEVEQKGEQASIEDKIMLGQLIEQTLKSEKARYQQLILQTLQPEAADLCLHDLANDEMILNAAFLLEKENEETFNTLIQTLDQRLESAINFRVVGPLPLYSFATIVFEKIAPERIEEAKKILGLTGEVTEKRLRDAYHQLAQKYHPDKMGGEAPVEFQEIHGAYQTLKNFLENGLIHSEVYRWKEDVQ